MTASEMTTMFLLLTSLGIVAGIPLRDYNVTFPCGPQENNQRCRFPDEFCDINLGSCSGCNEDICREQDSDPSCRAYCYDRATSVTKNPTTRDSLGKNSESFGECRLFSIPMVICAVLTFVQIPLFVLFLKIRKIRNLQKPQPESIPIESPQRTDKDNVMTSPTS